MPILDDICTAKTKGIAAKDVAQTGKYPVFGATGLVGYLDTFEVENEYVGIIKDGAGVGRTNIYPDNHLYSELCSIFCPKKILI